MVFEWLAGNTTQILLIFILLFTLVFGVLQKSKLFGDGKKQIDALIALAIALLTTSVAYALDIIKNLVPFLAVGLVIILVFILLIGLFHSDAKDGFKSPKWMTTTAIVIAFVVLLVAVVYVTGFWSYLSGLWKGSGTNIIGNIVTVAIVIGVVVIVFLGSGKSEKSP